MKNHVKHLLTPLILTGCIGVDVLDDEVVEEVILVKPDQVCLIRGDQRQLSGKYYNKFGILMNIDFSWKVKNTAVLTVDNNGRLNAVKTGQTTVTASFGQTVSNKVLVTVVDDVNDIAQ